MVIPKLTWKRTDEIFQRQFSPNGTELSVSIIKPQEVAEWDAFVRSSPDGLPTQLAAWQRIITHTYGHRCFFLLARQSGRIQGVLPLFFVSSQLTGRRLDSLPGALCAASPQAAQALILAADSLARELKVSYLLLRDSRTAWPEAGLEVVEAHRGIRRVLTPDVDAAWKSLPKDVRYHVRNGRKQAELKIEIDSCGLEDFYDLLLRFNHESGTPLFGLKFLRNVVDHLTELYQVVRVYLEGKPIAGYLNFATGQTIYGMWGGALRDYRNYKVGHQTIWAMIEANGQAGYTLLDMGRSGYPSSQYDFKIQWGDSTYPIYQLYRVYKGKKPSDVQYSSPGGSAEHLFLFRQAYQRLPIQAARALGPLLRWHIPFG